MVQRLPEVWPENEVTTLRDFEETRALTQRAAQEAFKRLYRKYFNGTERVLEVGSGTGYFSRQWPSEFSGEWVHLEPQQAFIEEARRKNPVGIYVNGSIYHIPFDDQSFDGVCGLSSFDVFYDLEAAVREADRVLKRGGLFFHVLDIGANYDVVDDDFKEKRVPLMISRTTTRPSLFSRHCGDPLCFRYIPSKTLDLFLAEVGMTRREMDTLPSISGFFALKKFSERFRCEQGPNDVFGALPEYENLFDRYAHEFSPDVYFHDKFVRVVSSVFGTEHINAGNLIGSYVGKRTAQQATQYPECFVFQKTNGTTSFGRCLRMDYPFYLLQQACEHRFPRLAGCIEPWCYERVTFDCVLVQKA